MSIMITFVEQQHMMLFYYVGVKPDGYTKTSVTSPATVT